MATPNPITENQLFIDIKRAWQSREITKCRSLLGNLISQEGAVESPIHTVSCRAGLVRLAVLQARCNNALESLQAFERWASGNTSEAFNYSSLRIGALPTSSDEITLEEISLWWGYSLIRLQRLDEAQMLVDAASVAEPLSSLIQLLATMVSFRKGNQDFSLFQRAVDLRPSPEAFVRYIAHLVLSGKSAEAVQVATRAETTLDVTSSKEWMPTPPRADRLLSAYLSSLPTEFLQFPELYCHAILKAIHRKEDDGGDYSSTLTKALEAAPIPPAVVKARFDAFITDLSAL